MGASGEIALPAAELADQLRRGRIQLIDVRTEADRASGAIKGARPMALEDLAHEGMTLDRERPVAFCGGQATEAAALLREQGYTAFALVGDVAAWREAGLPIERAR
jgi:cysteine synthase B